MAQQRAYRDGIKLVFIGFLTRQDRKFMWLIAMKGLSGCGKSTLSYAFSRELGWPLIDKDDIRDLLDNHATEAGGLSYDIMFNIARRQLSQGLNVICDSPLTSCTAYEHAQATVTETRAHLGIIECHCSDETLWKQRINDRKALQLSVHRQTDWEAFQVFLRRARTQTSPTLLHPHLTVDSARPFHECLTLVLSWLDQIQQLS
jgi:predicted kinase